MTGANASLDWLRYWPYAVCLVIGAGFAVIDRRVFGRHVLAIALVLIAVGGAITLNVSPFTFAGGDYYFIGLIAMVAAGVALGGYISAAVWHVMRARTGGDKTT